MIGKAFDVIIIGGGVAGLSIALELAKMGLKVALFEKGLLGQDASTGNHGWLHRGSLYVLHQFEVALACERAFHKIRAYAPESLEVYSGCFYLLSDPQAEKEFVNGWVKAGIPYKQIDPDKLRRQEPVLQDSPFDSAFLMPDAVFRPSVLLRKLKEDALRLGARIFTNAPVNRLIVKSGEVTAVQCQSQQVRAGLIINATGAWTKKLLKPLGIPVDDIVIFKAHIIVLSPIPTRSMLIFLTWGAPTLVPHGERMLVSQFGGSSPVVDEPSDHRIPDPFKQWEIYHILSRWLPALDLKRYDMGIYSCFKAEYVGSNIGKRERSQAYAVIDHEEPRHGNIKNLITALPGKFCLFPLLSEEIKQVVAEKL